MSEPNLPQISTQTNIISDLSNTSDMGWLRLSRVGWISIVVPAYALFLAHIPVYFASLHHLHAPGVQMLPGQLTRADVHTLQVWGLSLDFYATCVVVVSLLFQGVYATVGVLLFWKKSDERIALFTSFALMMLPFGWAYLTLQGLPPDWFWLIPLLSTLGNASLLLCGFVFPDGRFVPRWTRWLALVMLGYWVVVTLLPSWRLDQSWLSFVLFFGFVITTVLIQLYRYHRVSTLRQRQQTKWVLLGVSIAGVGNIWPRLLYAFALYQISGGSGLVVFLRESLIMGSMLAIPLTLGLAVLRDRLWDIDVIINRALVYGTLTAMLALIYLSLVIGLQSLLQFFVDQTNDVAIVASTLAVAALFQPLRHHLQAIIDRRFYRRKYNAAKTLEAFSATLRNDLDLDRLHDQLLKVIEETMQPCHVSLWLRDREPSQQQKRPGGFR